MKKIVVVVAILAFLVLGCTKEYNYPTAYVAYGQQGQPPAGQNPQYQGAVGGGCVVEGPDASEIGISDSAAAA